MKLGKELKKILFVDDDEDLHMIVKICLRDIPQSEVQTASSGEEAIKIAMQYHPDLIILDMMMPQMDGIATLEAIRLLPSIAHTPIIFLTAKAQKAEIDGYLKLGILDVIVKPFDPLTFASIVEQDWKKNCLEKK